MKKIYFDNLRNWFWLSVLVISLLLIVVGTFEFFDFTNTKTNRRLSILGFLLQLVYYSRIFWYKNYVQYNKKGAVVKLNAIFSKSISFKRILKVERLEEKLILTKNNGSNIKFNVSNIRDSDIEKFSKIILENIGNTS